MAITVSDGRKNTPIAMGGFPFSYPAYGGIAGVAPPGSSPAWEYNTQYGDVVDRAVLTGWGSNQLEIEATFINIVDSLAAEYWVSVLLADTSAGFLRNTMSTAIPAPGRFARTTVSVTFDVTDLGGNGPYVAAWGRHLEVGVSPTQDAPELCILGFHVQQA